MTYTIIVVTRNGYILRLSDQFYDLKNAKTHAKILSHELGDAVQNVQIKAAEEHHIETIGMSSLP